MLKTAISVCALFISATSVSAGAFIRLGDLPGGDHLSDYNSVSALGTVAVGYSKAEGNADRGVRWRLCDGMKEIPGLASAIGVSGDGKVIVGNQSPGGVISTNCEGYSQIVDPGSGIAASSGMEASYDGSTVAILGVSSSGFVAASWTPEGGLIGLGDLPGGGVESQALGISHDGSVIVGRGHSTESGSGWEAFRWTSGTNSMMGLGDLDGGQFNSQAEAVSGNGLVIVGRGESADGPQAFRWTSDTGMQGIGDLPGGAFSSWAWSTTFDGSVIVVFSESANGRTAFIWTMADGMRELQDVLSADYGLDLTGWHLEAAFGISADGNAIVGRGLNPDGEWEGWIAYLNCIPGDGNGDQAVNGLDANEFLQVLLDSGSADETTICTYDLNRDGSLNLLDISAFVDLLFSCDC